MTMANIVARMELREIRGRRRVIPGLRCAPSGLRSLRVRPNLLKRINKRTRGCGCHGHPAFPTPSLGGRFINASGALRHEVANARLELVRRHCEERSDEAIHSFLPRHDGLLRFARNDVEVAAPYMRDATQANVAPTLPSPDNSIVTWSPALSHTVLTRLPVSTNSPARRALPSEAR
jgi:hypothetical protein